MNICRPVTFYAGETGGDARFTIDCATGILAVDCAWTVNVARWNMQGFPAGQYRFTPVNGRGRPLHDCVAATLVAGYGQKKTSA